MRAVGRIDARPQRVDQLSVVTSWFGCASRTPSSRRI
jgi:hypothetical protein